MPLILKLFFRYDLVICWFHCSRCWCETALMADGFVICALMESIVCSDRFVSSRTTSSKPSLHHYQQQQQQQRHQAVGAEWVDDGPQWLRVAGIAADTNSTRVSVRLVATADSSDLAIGRADIRQFGMRVTSAFRYDSLKRRALSICI